jgi:large subunit ribosomal protein L16
MLSPKKTKYRKMHRGRLKGIAIKNNKLSFGLYGLQACQPAWITSKQIETSRQVISKIVKKSGKLWIKIFPDKAVTARTKESRMGSGKGAVSHWVAVVKPGTIIFEIDYIDMKASLNTLKVASYKLPLKTKILIKNQ